MPLAISGALVFTFLDLTTINIYSQVGLITLVGLIAKNGILIVEFANTLQARGLDKLAALREASLTRLRPVLMTSAATVFGHLPLVLVTGPGAEARNSIGTVLVAGMTVGTRVHAVRGAGVLLADRRRAPAGAGAGSVGARAAAVRAARATGVGLAQENHMFGKPVSAYLAFQKVVLVVLATVGLARLGLSLAGVPNAAAAWLSMNAVGWAGVVYYGVAVHTRGFGSYKQLLPLAFFQIVLQQAIAVLGILLAIAGLPNVYAAPEFSFGAQNQWLHAALPSDDRHRRRDAPAVGRRVPGPARDQKGHATSGAGLVSVPISETVARQRGGPRWQRMRRVGLRSSATETSSRPSATRRSSGYARSCRATVRGSWRSSSGRTPPAASRTGWRSPRSRGRRRTVG